MGALVMFGLVSVIAIVGVIYFNHQDKKKRKEIDMGTIAVSIFVTVVAVVGFFYFTYQDKKEALKNKK